jgi:putative DNA primase/helicase
MGILSLLKGVKPSGENKWQASCPAHDDKVASLSVKVTEEGKWLLKCHAGCETAAVCAAIGLTFKDLFPPSPRTSASYDNFSAVVEAIERRTGAHFVKEWVYHWPDGSEALRVCRFEGPQGKTYRPVHQIGGEWREGDPQGKLPLYRLADLNGAVRVLVVEGEKCADRAKELGFTATTSAHGAQAPQKSDWTPLAKKEVAILPDNDPAGLLYAEKVAALVTEHGARVRLVRLPGLDESGDIADYQGDRESIERLIVETAPWVPPVVVEGPADSRTRLLTDIGNAARLVKRNALDLRYCAPWGKWLCWDGKRWAVDETKRPQELAQEIALSIVDEVKNADGVDEQKAIWKWYLASQRRERVNAMLDLAGCHLAVTPDRLDADPWLLNVENGTLDLRTGKLLPHSRDNLITKLAPVSFDPDAKCPLWRDFLERVMAQNENLTGYLRVLAGVCLTGDVRDQVLFIFYGQGANGKSVFLDTLLSLLGDYALTTPSELLTTRNGRDEHPTEVASLYGKRLAVAYETESGRTMRVQLVKQLTGNTRLSARFMRQDYFQFDRTHKLILATNNRPSIRESSLAVWRRIRLVPWTVTIPPKEQDQTLTTKLRAEWPGILSWALLGCLDWQEVGLESPPEVDSATSDYREEQDRIGEFIRERCELVAGTFTSYRLLYAEYLDWCKSQNDNYPLGRLEFTNSLVKIDGVEKTRATGGQRGFQGVVLSSK